MHLTTKTKQAETVAEEVAEGGLCIDGDFDGQEYDSEGQGLIGNGAHKNLTAVEPEGASPNKTLRFLGNMISDAQIP